MGQRLNLEILNGEELLANCYYHWSGYTESSIELTLRVLEYIENNPSNEITRKRAIELLESTGASFKESEFNYAKSLGLINGEYIGVEYGHIGISNEAMKNIRDVEEARVQIDILNKKINFLALWEYEKNDYDDTVFEFKEIENIKSNIGIDFESFTDFAEQMLNQEAICFKNENEIKKFITIM